MAFPNLTSVKRSERMHSIFIPLHFTIYIATLWPKISRASSPSPPSARPSNPLLPAAARHKTVPPTWPSRSRWVDKALWTTHPNEWCFSWGSSIDFLFFFRGRKGIHLWKILWFLVTSSFFVISWHIGLGKIWEWIPCRIFESLSMKKKSDLRRVCGMFPPNATEKFHLGEATLT